MLAWLAGSAMQFARLCSQSFSERGSARFSFHFPVRAYVQGTPDARLQRPRHVFRRILPSRAFLFESADSAALPHPGRRIPDRSLSPPKRYLFPKSFKRGSGRYQHLERGANEMVSNICSPNSFSTERVLLLSAESVCRT